MNRSRSESTVPLPSLDKLLFRFRVAPTLLAFTAATAAFGLCGWQEAVPQAQANASGC